MRGGLFVQEVGALLTLVAVTVLTVYFRNRVRTFAGVLLRAVTQVRIKGRRRRRRLDSRRNGLGNRRFRWQGRVFRLG